MRPCHPLSLSLCCIRTDTSLTSPHLTFNAFPFHTFFWQSSTTPQHPIAHPRSTLAQSTARNMGSCLLVHTLSTSSNSTLLAHSPHTIRAKIPITPCPSPARIPLTRTRGKDEQLPRHTHLSTPRPFLFSFPDDLAPHKLEAACHSNKKKQRKKLHCTALHCTLHAFLNPPARPLVLSMPEFPCLLGTLLSPFAAFAENPQNAPPTACCSWTCVTITAHGPPPITYRTLAVITFQSYQVSFFSPGSSPAPHRRILSYVFDTSHL
ncbi:hypothetical protein CMEL01_06634 [Colletotrichum melonis]|uniref:Uncharacterized protein n=1 Tax=Colletotrichum melonis TaxID=1209925 RepID=A0AAI9U5G6_9PEZI|nr:hypothetical protein CMEL01_06634 [Colletotrichum melonis]